MHAIRRQDFGFRSKELQGVSYRNDKKLYLLDIENVYKSSLDSSFVFRYWIMDPGEMFS